MFVIHRSAPDLCFYLCISPLKLTKGNRSQNYLNKPTQKSEGFPAELSAGSHGLPSGKETEEFVFRLQFLKNQKIDHM